MFITLFRTIFLAFIFGLEIFSTPHAERFKVLVLICRVQLREKAFFTVPFVCTSAGFLCVRCVVFSVPSAMFNNIVGITFAKIF